MNNYIVTHTFKSKEAKEAFAKAGEGISEGRTNTKHDRRECCVPNELGNSWRFTDNVLLLESKKSR